MERIHRDPSLPVRSQEYGQILLFIWRRRRKITARRSKGFFKNSKALVVWSARARYADGMVSIVQLPVSRPPAAKVSFQLCALPQSAYGRSHFSRQ